MAAKPAFQGRKCAFGGGLGGSGNLLGQPRRYSQGSCVERWAVPVGRACEGIEPAPCAPHARRSVANLANAAGEVRLAQFCGKLLHDAEAADAGEAALLRLAETAATRGEMVEELAAAVLEGCRAFWDHRRRGILAAAALMLDLPSRAGRTRAALGRWFMSLHAEMVAALGTGLNALRTKAADRRAWEWLDADASSVRAWPGLAAAGGATSTSWRRRTLRIHGGPERSCGQAFTFSAHRQGSALAGRSPWSTSAGFGMSQFRGLRRTDERRRSDRPSRRVPGCTLALPRRS